MTVDIISMQAYLKTCRPEDRDQFCDQWHINKNQLIILYVGRLEYYKGVQDLLAAFANMPQMEATLLIVGDGSLRSQVEKNAQQDKRIHYLERLEGNALWQLYFVADVVVVPSHSESWGLVVNEAMAAGKAVIVADCVGCIDDLVHHLQTGLIYRSGMVNELQTMIAQMVAYPKMTETMGERAIQHIAQWTLENEAKNICNAWNQLLLT